MTDEQLSSIRLRVSQLYEEFKLKALVVVAFSEDGRMPALAINIEQIFSPEDIEKFRTLFEQLPKLVITTDQTFEVDLETGVEMKVDSTATAAVS